jgi:hypothetical protein
MLDQSLLNEISELMKKEKAQKEYDLFRVRIDRLRIFIYRIIAVLVGVLISLISLIIFVLLPLQSVHAETINFNSETCVEYGTGWAWSTNPDHYRCYSSVNPNTLELTESVTSIDSYDVYCYQPETSTYDVYLQSGSIYLLSTPTSNCGFRSLTYTTGQGSPSMTQYFVTCTTVYEGAEQDSLYCVDASAYTIIELKTLLGIESQPEMMDIQDWGIVFGGCLTLLFTAWCGRQLLNVIRGR